MKLSKSRVQLLQQLIRYVAARPIHNGRYLLRWLNTVGKETLNLQHPWILHEAVDWVVARLPHDASVLEWGSGGSTIFFAQRAKHVTSVEYDKEWFEGVREELGRLNVENVTLKYVSHDSEPSSNSLYLGRSRLRPRPTFEAYVRVIDAVPDGSLDLVVIDGRARSACVRHAKSKIKPGGLLMLDNAERANYQEAIAFMSDWPRTDFYGPVPTIKFLCKTYVWQRIEG